MANQYIDTLKQFIETDHSPVTQSAQQTAVALYQRVVQQVPAYAQFLHDHDIADPNAISVDTFAQLPLVTKQNYVNAYPLPERCWEGKLEQCEFVAFSSGSTGTPTLWPRSLNHEVAIAERFDAVFRDSFQAHQKPTLAVVCFALGTWVGGMFTSFCLRYLAQKGYPITLVTPGNNKTEILRVVKQLSPFFEQTVLLGYPPFVKDVVDSGCAENINWQALQIKLVFAGEVFSEEWRELMYQRLGTSNPYHDSVTLYGTADAGVLGNETPLSICIRRYLAKHPDVSRALFGESRLPTLVQYDPHQRYFEVTPEHTLVITGDNGVPLIRYHIADKGGLFSYQELLLRLQQHGFDPITELSATENPSPNPFVYVFGRADFTVSFFGANIYPENISVALEQPDTARWVTGKFVLSAKPEAQTPYLSIAIELLPNVSAAEVDQPKLIESIVRELKRLNSEFANYVPETYQTPQVSLHPFGDPDYFPVGIKHRYTRKT